jgi:ABC-type transporter Mla subunit MlaD
MNKTITIRVSNSLFTTLQDQADNQKTTVTNLVRSLLIEKINSRDVDKKLDKIISSVDQVLKEINNLAVEVA